MRQQLLKSIIIYTLSVLTTGSCLSLGLWQNNNSPKVIIQTPFNVGLGLRSSIPVPSLSGLFGRQRGTNHLEESANHPNEILANDSIAKEYEINRIHSVKNQYDSKLFTEKNHNEIEKKLTTTDETNSNTIIDEIYTTETSETTTFTSETYSTEDYETVSFITKIRLYRVLKSDKNSY
ncbi:hypothetical protein O3G_MSEX005569 [Manduca sexta]|uniref:Uncharacterized protein n=1 Tax=Manduca sexta TaxID=7130 RepID=A0A921Z0R3_MANSE|nr:hypothetical protein O3G_MSEX005569 [Manduca sexta]